MNNISITKSLEVQEFLAAMKDGKEHQDSFAKKWIVSFSIKGVKFTAYVIFGKEYD
jgi:hypothetical protein